MPTTLLDWPTLPRLTRASDIPLTFHTQRFLTVVEQQIGIFPSDVPAAVSPAEIAALIARHDLYLQATNAGGVLVLGPRGRLHQGLAPHRRPSVGSALDGAYLYRAINLLTAQGLEHQGYRRGPNRTHDTSLEQFVDAAGTIHYLMGRARPLAPQTLRKEWQDLFRELTVKNRVLIIATPDLRTTRSWASKSIVRDHVQVLHVPLRFTTTIRYG